MGGLSAPDVARAGDVGIGSPVLGRDDATAGGSARPDDRGSGSRRVWSFRRLGSRMPATVARSPRPLMGGGAGGVPAAHGMVPAFEGSGLVGELVEFFVCGDEGGVVVGDGGCEELDRVA